MRSSIPLALVTLREHDTNIYVRCPIFIDLTGWFVAEDQHCIFKIFIGIFVFWFNSRCILTHHDENIVKLVSIAGALQLDEHIGFVRGSTTEYEKADITFW